jgi:G3E family GTPase
MPFEPSGRERVPATLLTGFLGSGKTTLLNGLLREPHGLKLAVIVNELGEVGIDGKIVKGGESFVELDNGCLCCALNADLDRVLKDLRAKGGFDHLVIETTGLADPLPIGWAFSRPGLSDFYRLDAIVTVVDAAHVDRALAAAPEAELQLRRADLVVVNKLDLVEDNGAAAASLVRAVNELAPILKAVRGAVPWTIVLGGAWERPPLPPPAPEGHHHHTPSLESFSVAFDATVDDVVLEDLLAEVPPQVYRVKGLARTRDGGWLLANVVAGRIDIVPYEPARPVSSGALVFIGEALDCDGLRSLCAQYLGSLPSGRRPG